MGTKTVPFTEEFIPAVKAFNKRMQDGGSQWGFYTDPIPDWIPRQEDSTTWREYHLALEDEETVRGGYALKPQAWYVNGRTEMVTDWQGPFTEADIDVKYAPLMLRLMRGMQKQYPLLFSLGHGGVDAPMVKLLQKMGWEMWGVPFSFFVNHPFNFLRKNRYLRSSSLRRLALDIAAFSGLGWLAMRIAQAGIRMRARAPTTPLQTTVVDEFGPWADELWEAQKTQYSCLAVRDSHMMNALMPATGWPGGTRLQFTDTSGATLGWSVVHHKQQTNDPRFGTLNVGLISDCFAAPKDAADIMQATHAYLSSQNVDMIFANLSHSAWNNGLKSCGHIVLEHRRMFAISPALWEALAPHDTTQAGLHLTNMDGHGPHGFYD